MGESVISPSFASDLPPMPTQVISFDGQTVDTNQVRWLVRAAADGGNQFGMNWQLLHDMNVGDKPVYSPRARHLMQLYIADRLERRKPTTASVYFSSFIKFGKWLADHAEWYEEVCRPDGFEWSSYSESLARVFLVWGVQNTASNGDFFRHLRIFYRWGVARRYSGFSLSLLRILKAIKATMHPVGHHVRFRHPTEGPFSPEEKRLIVLALHSECGLPTDRALVMLLLELGLRPKAAARLQKSDLVCVKSRHGTFYQLAVPRLKQRHAERETKRRPISQRLGSLLTQLQAGSYEDHLLHWLGQKMPEGRMRQAVKRWAKTAGLVSPRTGKRLKCNPRRFRYTLATHLAEEGASKIHIAAILDHSDLKYVDVYTSTTSAITEQVALATDAALGPIVQRFLGCIIDNDTGDGVESVIPATTPHIPLPILNVGGIGYCGRDVQLNGLCHQFPPLSCYLCPSFAALRDGPHQLLLNELEQFLQQEQEQTDARIQGQLDSVLVALRELLVQLNGGLA